MNSVNYQKAFIFIILFFGMMNFNVFAEEKSWEYHSYNDELTDEKVHIAYIIVDVKLLVDTAGVIRCKGKTNSLEVFFETGSYVGGDIAKVKYRFDKGQIKNEIFPTSTDGTAIFVPSHKVEKFLESLKNNHELVMRVYDYNDSPHTAKFPLKNSKKTISKVVSACNK